MAFLETPRFPTDLKYGSLSGPTMSTNIVVTGGGTEYRNANWSLPIYRFNAKYMVKTRTTAKQVYDLFIASQGRFGGFRFKDAWDFSSASNGSASPSNTDQVLGVGDASQVDFQLIKSYAAGSSSLARKITKPVVAVGVGIGDIGGVPQVEDTHFSVDYTTGVITFSIAPSIGVSIVAGFEFDVPVRFDSDDLSDLAFALSTTTGEGDIVGYGDIPLTEIRI